MGGHFGDNVIMNQKLTVAGPQGTPEHLQNLACRLVRPVMQDAVHVVYASTCDESKPNFSSLGGVMT